MARTYKFDLRTRRISTLKGGTQVVYSSRPYPLGVTENISAAHSFVRGSLFDVISDDLDCAHSFVSGQLRDVLQHYAIPDEAVDVAHSFVSGDLRDVLKTYSNWPAEAIDAAHSFVSGTLT